MRSIDSLDDNRIPPLFIHGEDDEFILPRNSIDMYDRNAVVKDLKLIPKEGHAESILTDPEAYQLM